MERLFEKKRKKEKKEGSAAVVAPAVINQGSSVCRVGGHVWIFPHFFFFFADINKSAKMLETNRTADRTWLKVCSACWAAAEF